MSLRRPWFPHGVLAVLFATPALAGPITYTDDFEGTSIDPFWTLIYWSGVGTYSLSPNQAHSGAQSLEFVSPGGAGDRVVYLGHLFPSTFTGTATVWFYDVSPGQQTNYEGLRLINSVTNAGVSVGIADFDALCYSVAVYDPVLGDMGPNAGCGSYPQLHTSNVPRTPGWHRLTAE